MADTPEYFQLRPEVEQAYGYTHAVRIGSRIKISGAVSMDAEGAPTAVGDWLEVKGLALPEFMIEIEMEAHRTHTPHHG